MPRDRTPAPACFMWIFMGIWSAVVVPFNGLAGWTLWQQTRTADFAETEGVITKSTLKCHSGSKGGKTYSLDVEYDYEVDGRKFTGTRYCYGEMSTNDGTWSKVQKELPAGKTVPVYYDPADPSDAVLRRGLTGIPLFLFWFLTPFNVVLVGGWYFTLRKSGPGFDPANPRHVATTSRGWIVHLPGISRLGAFAATLLVVTFLGIFAIGFTTGFDPPVGLMVGAFAGAFGLATLAALTFASHPRLEVDDLYRTLHLPPGGRGADEVPFADVSEITVTEERQTGSKGRTWFVYHCNLHRNGANGPTRLAKYHQRSDAEALAAWLREKIGLKQE
jgi:hypothetical protein